MLPDMTGTGRLTNDPEIRYTPQGKALCKVPLAFNSRRKNRDTGEWEDGDVFFVTGTLWDQPAENAAESLSKGMEVLVTGRVKTRQWQTDDGEKRSMPELLIDTIGPSLRWAQARVRKVERGQNGGEGGSWGQQGGNGGGDSEFRRTGGGTKDTGYDDPWGSAPPAAVGAGNADEGPPF